MSVDRQLSQAKSFIRQGRPSLAAQQYLDILDRFPKNQRALTGLAEAIRQPDAQTVEILADELETLRLVYKTGDLQTAFAIGSALLPKASHIPQLRSNLGAIALDLGDTQRASAEFELAAKLDPTQPVGWLNLAAAQLRAERYVEALAAAERALLLAPKNGRAQVVYAQICIAMGKVAEALDILSRYTGTGPEEMEARISLGVAQESAGDKDAALATWAAVLDKYPGSAAALYNYTAIAKATAENNMADQVKEAITKERHAAAPSSSALTHLHFAAAKIHHDLEEYPQAFDNYRLGNLLKREEEGYNSEEDQMRMNFVKSNFPIQNFPQLPSDAIAAPGRPIFIVSLPRSGSTLIEQILSSHSQVTDGGELDTLTHAVRDTGGVTAPITPDRLADIRDRYFSGIQARGISGPVFTDKMPLNFRLIGYIALAIPEASVVHMIR
ncbi:MAG: tetratricopeptide repeat-containing sulfotransferase family protein, partial [Mangrovicoccus sp.]